MEITHPTYKVFAANVTCKERSPNLEIKVNKSVIDVIVLIKVSIAYWKPEHVFAGEEVAFNGVSVWPHH